MNKVYNITDFGAVSNDELQTTCIQSAIDECFLNGGGEVIIPEGVFLTGGIRLRSNVTLHLMKNAVLKGSRNPEDYFSYLDDKLEPLREGQITDAYSGFSGTYGGETEEEKKFRSKRVPGSRWNNALIRSIDAENIAIIGEDGSIIDGSNCYDSMGEEKYRGPHGMTFFNTKNITLKGYTIQHTGNWAHNMIFCDQIKAEHITVLAGHDGLDVFACKNVYISDCEFYTGDDCIAGYSNINVFVSNCITNSACSAFRFAGTNVIIDKCHMYAPCKYGFRGLLSLQEKIDGVIARKENARTNMLSAFTYYAAASVPIPDKPGNIVIRNCKIDGADRFLHYNYSGNEPWQRCRPLSDICFENIEATNISMPLTAYGDEDEPIKLTLKNVTASMRDNADYQSFMLLRNFEKVEITNLKLTNFKADCLIKKGSEGKIELTDVSCSLPDEQLIQHTDEEFIISPI